MKKSHRKDVIIARIIFAVLCLILIILIVAAVNVIRAKLAERAVQETTETSELTGQLPPESENPLLPEVTENTEETTQENTEIWTSDGVNLRAEPNTNCDVIAVLGLGTKLELIDEADGWVHVSYDGKEGYISSEFITGTNPLE